MPRAMTSASAVPLPLLAAVLLVAAPLPAVLGDELPGPLLAVPVPIVPAAVVLLAVPAPVVAGDDVLLLPQAAAIIVTAANAATPLTIVDLLRGLP